MYQCLSSSCTMLMFETMGGVCNFASSPRGQRRTASPVWRAAHCTCAYRGQSPLDPHQPVAILVETSGCCHKRQRDQSHLPAGQSVSICGEHPIGARRSRCVDWTPGPVDCLLATGAPLQQSAASAIPEGSHRASCRGKPLSRFLPSVQYPGYTWYSVGHSLTSSFKIKTTTHTALFNPNSFLNFGPGPIRTRSLRR